MSEPKLIKFSVHDATGQSILDKDRIKWAEEHQGQGFGPIVEYSWEVEGNIFRVPANRKKIIWEELPDGAGFICFESEWKPDNCVLLDVYGKERMRLTVPWQLTKHKYPESANPPTSFANISEPYINPADGKKGEFGVSAWVEYAGQYYFELDYHTGKFPWGKEIRD